LASLFDADTGELEQEIQVELDVVTPQNEEREDELLVGLLSLEGG
jgi:hypothetical protein